MPMTTAAMAASSEVVSLGRKSSCVANISPVPSKSQPTQCNVEMTPTESFPLFDGRRRFFEVMLFVKRARTGFADCGSHRATRLRGGPDVSARTSLLADGHHPKKKTAP